MEFRTDFERIEYAPKGFNIHAGPFHVYYVSEGLYRMHLDIEDRHLNQGGVIHGGVSMTLADNAMGIAAHHASGGRPTSTIEFGAKFLAAGKPGGPLYGAAVIERMTKDLCFMTAELWSDGRKTLTASGVWKFISPKAWK